MGKRTSLNKLIASIIILSYSMVLLMLIFLEGYLIANYQNTIRNEWKNALSQYADKVEADIDAINKNMYEIYSYDDNFQALRTTMGLESLSDGYQLISRLQTLELYEKKDYSYVLYYDDMNHRKYYFSQEIYENADIEGIKQYLDTIVSMDHQINMWRFSVIHDREYAICIYRSDNVALCEICSLAQRKKQLEAQLADSGAEVFFACDGQLMKNDAVTTQYEGIDLETDSFYHGSYIFKDEIGNTGLTMVLCIPAGIWTIMNLQQMVLVCIILGSVVVAYWLYKRLKRGLLVPLKQMTEEMTRISGGNMDSRIESTSNFEELQKTIETINLMVDEIQKQKMISYEQTIEKQQAQMQYLTMQLKPHFYLNSLKTLNVLAMNGEDEKIQDIILKLSIYLRNLLQAEKQEVALEREIDSVKNYVELQQATTERAITIDWQVHVERTGWMVPNLCIQTFVENSIKYAKLGGAAKELKIIIIIHELLTEEGTFLDIYVRDNGEGYSEEILNVINGPVEEDSRCVEINNLKRRCEILYGEKFEYAFGNDPGATASYILPWKDRGELG